MKACKTDVAIVGAGPAGIATAIQLKRSGVDFRLFETGRVGGLLHNAKLVENYPGYPEGVPGSMLAKRFHEHLQMLGIPVHAADVAEIEWTGERFRFCVEGGSCEASLLVLATGTIANQPKAIPGWETHCGSRCFTEVIHLGEVTGALISVVGGGDAAFDYALNLAARGNRVTIHMRGAQPRCLKLLERRVDASHSIVVRTRQQLLSIAESHRHLLLEWETGSKKTNSEEAEYFLAAIGRRPNLRCLSSSLQTMLLGLEESGRVYRIGDVARGHYRQTAIAVGDGIKAAMQISERLQELKAK